MSTNDKGPRAAFPYPFGMDEDEFRFLGKPENEFDTCTCGGGELPMDQAGEWFMAGMDRAVFQEKPKDDEDEENAFI